jgi:hypothetical protein
MIGSIALSYLAATLTVSIIGREELLLLLL